MIAHGPFAFLELQNVQEPTNFFERRVSAYQTAVEGTVAFDEAFWPTGARGGAWSPRTGSGRVARRQMPHCEADQ